MILFLRNQIYKYKEIFRLNKKTIVTIIFILLFIIFHLYLISQTFLIDRYGNIRSTITGYGDIPLHLTQITKFAFQNPINLNDPIYYGQKLDYPFLINLISGFLLRVTGNFSFSVLSPSFIFAGFNIIFVFFIYKKFLKSNLTAYLSVLLFYLGSGFGGLIYIQKALENKFNLVQFISYLIQNNITTVVRFDSKYPSQNIDFGSPLSLVFLHQRAFFMGFFGFLIFLLLIITAHQKSSKKLVLILAGIFFGLLPLMHTHSFIAASITIFSFISVALLKRDFVYFKKLIMVTIIGGIIALPQIIYLTTANSALTQAAGFIVPRLGWMVPPTIGSVTFPFGVLPTIFSFSFLEFLLLNFGIILPVFIICLVKIFFKRNILAKDNSIIILSFAFSGLVIFLLVQIIKFQPWDFDNNKLLVYFQFFAIPLILLVINNIYKKTKTAGIFIATIFICLALFSGVIDMIPRLAMTQDTLPVIFATDSQNMANYIKATIPQEELILTGTDHRNPVDALAGRSVLVGYPGWLWSRGINYSAREEEVKNFYAFPSKNNPLLKEFKIKYVLLDNQTIFDLKAEKAIFDRNFRFIYQVGQYTLYKI
jgi:hypothetical protein